jgi:hypothetical protein
MLVLDLVTHTRCFSFLSFFIIYQGNKRFETEPPVGPFGTKVVCFLSFYLILVLGQFPYCVDWPCYLCKSSSQCSFVFGWFNLSKRIITFSYSQIK